MGDGGRGGHVLAVFVHHGRHLSGADDARVLADVRMARGRLDDLGEDFGRRARRQDGLLEGREGSGEVDVLGTTGKPVVRVRRVYTGVVGELSCVDYGG